MNALTRRNWICDHSTEVPVLCVHWVLVEPAVQAQRLLIISMQPKEVQPTMCTVTTAEVVFWLVAAFAAGLAFATLMRNGSSNERVDDLEGWNRNYERSQGHY